MYRYGPVTKSKLFYIRQRHPVDRRGHSVALFLGHRSPDTRARRTCHHPPDPARRPSRSRVVRVSSHATLVCGECASPSGLVAQTVTRSALYAHRTVLASRNPNAQSCSKSCSRPEGLSNKEIHDAFRLPRTQRFGFASIDMPIAIEHRSRISRNLDVVTVVLASTERRL